MVARRTASDDGRRAEVSITAAGRRALARAPEPAQNRLLRAVEELPPGQRRQLAASLGQLVESMAIGDRPAEMFFEEPPAKRPRRGAVVAARGRRAGGRR
jgi:hypothetical protein